MTFGKQRDEHCYEKDNNSEKRQSFQGNCTKLKYVASHETKVVDSERFHTKFSRTFLGGKLQLLIYRSTKNTSKLQKLFSIP